MSLARKIVLCIGPLTVGSTTLQRMGAFQDLGYTVYPFNTYPYSDMRGCRLWRSIAYRWGRGYPIGTLNADLIEFARGLPCDMVWIDKGPHITAATLEEVRRLTGALMVHFTPDPAILYHRTSCFMKAIGTYDVLVTTKSFEIDLYKQNGARRVVYSPQGFDPELFKPYDLTDNERTLLGSDVCFIGHYEKHYLQCVQAATTVSDNVAVWGRWQRKLLTNPWLRKVWRGPGVWGVDYVKSLSAAKIGLGLLAKCIPETATTRSYEIPACGTFMLAERTDEHQTLFEEGKEAGYFGSDEELIDKTRYYLQHPQERKRIAAAGRQRCLSGGYSYRDRLQYCLQKVYEP